MAKGDAFGGQTIVDETRWKLVKRAVSDAIGDLRETLSQDEMASMRQKIGELNRPALKASINEFLAQHSVEVADLWPLFGSTSMPGLAEIRNRLAHGEVPTGDAITALAIARSHLRIILERCLLSVFGFLDSKSRASPSSVRLQTIVEHDRIEEFRRMLAPKIST